ncbi:MAG: GcvT family protein [Rhodobacterales bacterium]
MTGFPTTARVVIIGGGVVGTSALYHLCKFGWKDSILLEKNELTAGSTWHAAGNCPSFSTSWAIMNMQRYSLELYRGLAEKVDYPMNYHVTGSLRLAHSKNRMKEFERCRSMGKYQGMDLDIMQVSDMKDVYPFLKTHDLAGGLYDPDDGDIDPAQLTQALAKGARNMGGKIFRFTPAIGISREGDEWVVHTEKGNIRCEKVVNAAGYYAQRVGEWFKPFGGRTVPMATMSHQYFLTEPIKELEEWSKDNGKLPLLRDVDSSYYLRQEKFGLNLGPYERNCKAHWVTPEDPMPEDFSFQLYPDDLERLEWYIEDAMARVPILGTSGVGKVINGPIPYAPDGLPLVGPMPGVANAFEACVFSFGITQAGGAGKVLAEWVIEGETEWDMWAVDPRRYTSYADGKYCVEKAVEIYGHEYAMHFPNYEWPNGRNKKLSPIDERIRGLGGVMGAYTGWERANWFANPGDDTSLESCETWERSGPWEVRVKEECLAVRDSCGIFDETDDMDTLIITGPKSRSVLSLISDVDVNKGWLTHQVATVAGVEAFVIRVSYAGELGWEVHLKNKDVQKVYDSAKLNGAKPFGMYALNSLRIEKGYRAWKGELTTDYSLLEGGLDRFVKFDKPQEFIGKSALLSEMQQGIKSRFVTLIVDSEKYDAPYMSTIWYKNQIVGETTSGAWGYRVNKSIALGVIKSEFCQQGQSLEVEIYGERFNAIVQEDKPLWDPENERLRS